MIASISPRTLKPNDAALFATSSRDLSASKRKIAPTSLLPELRGTFAARELLENLWQTTSLKAVVCAIRFAIDSQAYRSMMRAVSPLCGARFERYKAATDGVPYICRSRLPSASR
jgi:hypothetical protein